jgi:hypothetical protein
LSASYLSSASCKEGRLLAIGIQQSELTQLEELEWFEDPANWTWLDCKRLQEDGVVKLWIRKNHTFAGANLSWLEGIDHNCQY